MIRRGSRAHVLVFLVVLFSAYVAARAEDLLGSDQKAYGKEVRIFSATQNGDRYETVTGRVLMDGTLAAPAKLFSDVDDLPGWTSTLIRTDPLFAHGVDPVS